MKNKKNVHYDLKKELLIIQDYNNFLLYVYRLVRKFPVEERILVDSIKKHLSLGLENVMMAKNIYKDNYCDKLEHLNRAQAHLNVLLLLVRLSRKMNYITPKNYTAWSFQITKIDNQITNWIRYLIKSEKD